MDSVKGELTRAERRDNLLNSVLEVTEIALDLEEDLVAVNLLMVLLFADLDVDAMLMARIYPLFKKMLVLNAVGLLPKRSPRARAERMMKMVQTAMTRMREARGAEGGEEDGEG